MILFSLIRWMETVLNHKCVKQYSNFAHREKKITTLDGNPACGRSLAVYEGIIKLSDFIKNILICVLMLNKGLMVLEQHEGE